MRLARIFTMCAALVAGGLFLATPNVADAGIRLHFGFGNSHYGHGHYGHGHYGHGHGYSRWHDTSHYDYHPGTYYRHGNHYHYQPGHYHLHRTGHWHHYGH